MLSSLMNFCHVPQFTTLIVRKIVDSTEGKSEVENPAAKKRKTEWQTAVKKMPGDTSFVKVGYIQNLFKMRSIVMADVLKNPWSGYSSISIPLR